jgi:membrane fusion protein
MDRSAPPLRPSSDDRANAGETHLPLFRVEAAQARRNQWLGSPHVGQPWPVQAVAIGGVAAALALVALLTLGQYTRRVTVQGVLASTVGTVRFSAPLDARVARLLVTEGEAVRAGQELYELAIDSTTDAGATQEEVQRILRRQRDELVAEQTRQQDLANRRKAALSTRISDLTREVAQIDRQANQVADFITTLEAQAQIYDSLFRRQLVTNRDLLERAQLLASQRYALETVRRDRITRESAWHEAAADLDKVDAELSTRLGDLRRQVNDIERGLAEAEARRALRGVASTDGTVTALVAHQNGMVRAGGPLLTITPAGGSLVAQLFAPSESIGFVRPGARVLMRYHAYPYQKFGQKHGIVTDISRTPMGIDEIDRGIPLGDGRAALFRITVQPDRPTVSLYGVERAPAIGERLEASVFLETRPIWQWILDPLYSLARAVDRPR